MSKDERERMYVANCLICSLAEAMKDCKVCPFRIGLLIKAEQENTRVSNLSTKGE